MIHSSFISLKSVRTALAVWIMTLLLYPVGLSAQTLKKVTGTVYDATGETLPGVTVVVVGNTNKGAMTGIDGTFTLENVASNAVLRFSYVGMKTQELPLNGKSELKVTMQEDSEVLDEVVVTALGIKREKKSLGYAIQEVQGEELTSTRQTNITNALSGKVAGLQVVKGGNGIAGSSKIVLRGNNSLTGDNQPLIVVDGVPMDNFTGATNNDFWNPSTDLGNGLGDLNPNDIASMSVLKGASAAALYGSRAGNGVILITTKNGAGQQGLGINLTSTTGFETPFMIPYLQTSFGQGDNGAYNSESGNSWGPAIDGSEVEKWDGTKAPLTYYDNIGNFLKTGINTQNSISISRRLGDGSSVYAALTHAYNSDLAPESKLNRFNAITRFVTNFGSGKEWTADAKVQYIKTSVHNRPISGNRGQNFWSTVLLMPGSIDIRDFSAGINDEGKHFWYNPKSGVNPYWAIKYSTNDDNRDRFLLNGSLKYKPLEWLSMEVNGGADIYTTNTNSKLYAGPVKTNGSYEEGKNVFSETNLSFLVSAQKDELWGKFGLGGSFGGNLMSRKWSGLSFVIGELEVPNLFSVNNYKGTITPGQTFGEHKINSLYGTLQLNWDRYLFLDLTGRNDWTSTLSPANRSFFYPSASFAFVFSELFNRVLDKRADWFTYGKLRASVAEVGNDMGPYQLYNTYTIGKAPNGTTTAGKKGTLYNENVVNELIRSIEIGLEMKFFDNRLGFDVAYYKSNAFNQLLNIPKNSLSGYSSEKINAGNIQNEGFELMVNAIPVEVKDFSWEITGNISKNVNTVLELAEGVTQYDLGQSFDNIKILAATGQRYGVIYGTKFARVEDPNSKYFGKVIVDESGVPTAASGQYYLGNQQPDMLFGLGNTLRYKNLSLSFQIDGRIGGKMYSYSNYLLKATGRSALTAPDGKRDKMVYDGVIKDGDSFKPNDIEVSTVDYWTKLSGKSSGNVGITEDNLFDATNVRLRNVSLSYDLPKEWLSHVAIQGMRVGLTVNNVWMIYSKMNGIDPESVYATGSNATGFESLSNPTTRSYYLNLSINF